MKKKKFIRRLSIFAIGVAFGVLSIYIPFNSYKQDNAILYSVLEYHNPINPLREYAKIMKNSDGNFKDIIDAYTQINRSQYCIATFASTSSSREISLEEYEKFRNSYQKVVDFKRFYDISSKLKTSNTVDNADLEFLQHQAERFDKLPKMTNYYRSFREYFYAVRDAISLIK